MPTSPYMSPSFSSPTGGVRLYDATLAPATELRGRTIDLRPLVVSDFESWREAIEANGDALSPYDTDDDGVVERLRGSADAFEAHVAWLESEAAEDRLYSFGVWRDDRLRGEAHLGGIVRGGIQSAFLGLWIDKEIWGQGAAREIFVLLSQFAFEELQLHRIEAFVSPDNAAVRSALEKLEIRHEGTSPRFRRVEGDWRDQERYAITAEEWAARRDELLETWVRRDELAADGA